MLCKHWTPRMTLLLEYCRCLYKLPECGAGGCLHILLDDNNYDDESLLFCVKYVRDHPECIEHDLAVLILAEYANMSMQERTLFDNAWNGRILECSDPTKCETCDLIEIPDWMEETK